MIRLGINNSVSTRHRGKTDIVRAIFRDATPGFSVIVEQAIRANEVALGPELVTNGGFDDGLNGWVLIGAGTTATSAGGVAVVTGDNSPGLRKPGVLTPGRSYVVSLTFRRPTGTNSVFVTPAVAAPTATTAWQTLKLSAVASSTHVEIGIAGPAGGAVLEVDNISVREIDLSRCQAFQDAAGTVPVVAMEQPLGLLLDASKGLVRGVELVADPSFSTPAAWITAAGWSVSGGKLVATGVAANSSTRTAIGVVTAGRWYEVSITCETISAGSWKLLPEGGTTQFSDKTTTGRFSAQILAGVSGSVYIWAASSLTATFDNISVREIPGNHLVQPSNTASRPIVRRKNNFLLNTDVLPTQNFTAVATTYILSFYGTGSITLSGAATGTLVGTGANNRVHMPVTTTAGTLTLTVSGSVLKAQLEFP